MLSRTLLAALWTAMALVALPASAARAQLRPGTAPVPGSPVQPPLAVNPGGTGPFAVVLRTRSGTTALGNATSVTFQNPTAAVGPSAYSRKANLGAAVVQFAPNNQLAQAITRTPCLAQGCTDAALVITYVTPQGTAVYTLEKVLMTRWQLGIPITAQFSYEKYMVRTGV